MPIAPGRSGDRYGLWLNCLNFSSPDCTLEWDEWNLARAFVTPADTVIEFGARYGLTSCALADAMNNSGRLVSVEPDSRAFGALLRNRQANRCNFHAMLGTVHDEPLALGHLSRFHYDQKTRLAHGRSDALPTLSFREVEAKIGSKFTCALIDCEARCYPSNHQLCVRVVPDVADKPLRVPSVQGCIRLVWATGLIHQLRLVMLEEDILGREYSKVWHPRLRVAGFVRVWNAIDHRNPRTGNHSAWVKSSILGSLKYVSCSEYRTKRKLPRRALRCAD